MPDKALKILTLIAILIAMAYAHHEFVKAKNYVYIPPAGYVASVGVKKAMKKMGPRYSYKMVGETRLYVDNGNGWSRLKY